MANLQYVFTQSSPATQWSVAHNLNMQYVNVEVIDTADNKAIRPLDITFTDANNLVIDFTEAVAGKASIVGSASSLVTGVSGYSGYSGTAGGIDGSGATDRLARWTDADSMGDGGASGPTMSSSGDVDMNDKVLEAPELKDYSESVNALGSVSGNPVNIDYTLGQVVTATIGGATTFAVTNPPVSGKAGSFTLVLTNGGTNVTWMSGTKWPGGSAPTLTASGIDVLAFFTTDGGTTWRGVLSMSDSK